MPATEPPSEVTVGAIAAELVSARRFMCTRCGVQAVVCSGCDRGQRYCGRDCSTQARRASLRTAGRRYQTSRAGRFAHARRAKRYRQRRQALQLSQAEPARCEIVTHHGSQDEGSGDVLRAELSGTQIQGEAPPRWHCGWCRRAGRQEPRSGFVGHGVFQQVGWWSRRDRPPGPSS